MVGLKSARFIGSELKDSPSMNAKFFKVNIDIRYVKDSDIRRGNPYLDFYIKYEFPQTGWKIESFGQ